MNPLREFCGIQSRTVMHGTDFATSARGDFHLKNNYLRSYFSIRNAWVGSSSLHLTIAEQAQEIASLATGSDSFVYLVASGFGSDKPEMHIEHFGEYPVRAIEFSIVDVTDQAVLPGQQYSFDDDEVTTVRIKSPIYRHTPKRLSRFPLDRTPLRSRYEYLVFCYANSGVTRQHLEFRHTANGWKQKNRVFNVEQETPKLILEHEDVGFGEAQVPISPSFREGTEPTLD